MALKKEVKVDKIEVIGEFSIQVRTRTSIVENGKEISANFHRHVLHPDSKLTGQDDRVKAIATSIFTKDVKKAWKDKKAQESA